MDTVVNRRESFFETVYMILLNLYLEEPRQSDTTYSMGLSQDELKRYFSFFLEKGLVRLEMGRFRVTERGRLFVERFEGLLSSE